MKNNKGYYSWIHSMKNAAMESHFKGRKMINESMSDEEYEKLPQAERIRLAGGDADLFLQMQAAKEAKRKKPLERSAKEEIARKQEIMSPRAKRLRELEDSEDERAADAAAMRSLQPKDKDLEPAGDLNADGMANAQDVAIDAANNVMGDQEPSESPEDADYWRRTMMPDEHTVIHESISEMIFKMLGESSEEDEEHITTETHKRKTRLRKGTKTPSRKIEGGFELGIPGEGRRISPGGVNWEALVDVYRNPKKYPPNIAKAVADAFKDSFSS